MKKWIFGIFGGLILLISGIEAIKRSRESLRKYRSDMQKRHEEIDAFIKEHEKFLKEHEKNMKELDEEAKRIKEESEKLSERYEKLKKVMDEEYYSKVDENLEEFDSCDDSEKKLDILRKNEEILYEAMERLEKEGIIKRPWKGDFDEFMSDPNNRLDFS